MDLSSARADNSFCTSVISATTDQELGFALASHVDPCPPWPPFFKREAGGDRELGCNSADACGSDRICSAHWSQHHDGLLVRRKSCGHCQKSSDRGSRRVSFRVRFAAPSRTRPGQLCAPRFAHREQWSGTNPIHPSAGGTLAKSTRSGAKRRVSSARRHVGRPASAEDVPVLPVHLREPCSPSSSVSRALFPELIPLRDLNPAGTFRRWTGRARRLDSKPLVQLPYRGSEELGSDHSR
jgi:hypothetical protein